MSSPFTPREQRRCLIERIAAHRLFHRMTARQGIDLTGGWWHGLEDKVFAALEKCELCARKKACRDWLEADGPLASYVTFCPNAGLIETCRISGRDAPRLGAEPLASCPEPGLSEILAEPIVQLVMASDHLDLAGADRR